MDTPIKVDSNIIEQLDKHTERLGFSRQRLANNLLKTAVRYLDNHGYEELLKINREEKKDGV